MKPWTSSEIYCVLYYSLSFTFGDHLVASKYQVELLCRLRSPYLLPLIGYCSESSHKLLVYEFMANGGLQEHLYPTNGMYLVFSWIWFCASWNLVAAFFVIAILGQQYVPCYMNFWRPFYALLLFSLLTSFRMRPFLGPCMSWGCFVHRAPGLPFLLSHNLMHPFSIFAEEILHSRRMMNEYPHQMTSYTYESCHID